MKVGDVIRCEREVRGEMLESLTGAVAFVYNSHGKDIFMTKDRGEIGRSGESDTIFLLWHNDHITEGYEVGEKFSIDYTDGSTETFTRYSEGWWVGDLTKDTGRHELKMYDEGQIRSTWDHWATIRPESLKGRVS